MRWVLTLGLLLLACGDDDVDDTRLPISDLGRGSTDAGPITEERCEGLGLNWCDPDCVNTELDERNCGSCGNVCDEEPCRAGECGGPCPASQPVACGAECCSRCDATGMACVAESQECPEPIPTDGSACADIGASYEGARCDWLRCDADGFVEASCDSGETWTVSARACAPVECGGMVCAADAICVQRAGGALLTECAANPCGDGPLYPFCMCELCPDGAGCTVDGQTVTCNTCPEGTCP